MILHLDGGRWYIDVRAAPTSEQLSYDLTQHLPRRLAAGQVMVVCDNPKVFLSVIRKRWMKLLYEVECQRSSTLDVHKKEALQAEVARMRSAHFTARSPGQIPAARLFFIAPSELTEPLPAYTTLYITTPLTATQIGQATAPLTPGGLVVLYGDWLPVYEPVLQQTYS